MQGQCFCGAIRYELSGPYRQATDCHCSMCRRISGAASVAWVTVQRDQFRLLAGTPKSFRSSGHATRSFCAACGTPLTFCSDRLPDEIDVTIASLDEPDRVPPEDHTWVSSKLGWVEISDRLPQFEKARP
ncbi:MAG TPA: GFA family protein [Polyangiaceae bacterium]